MALIAKSLRLIEEAGGTEKIESSIRQLGEGSQRNTAILLFKEQRKYPDLVIQPRTRIEQDVIRKAIARWAVEPFGGKLYQRGVSFRSGGFLCWECTYHLVGTRQSVMEGSYELLLVTNLDKSIEPEYLESTIALTVLLAAMAGAIIPGLLSLTISIRQTTESVRRGGISPSWYWTQEVLELFEMIKAYKIGAELYKVQIDQSTSGQMIVRSKGMGEALIYSPNKAIAKISGYTQAELEGKPLNLIVPEEFHKFHAGVGAYDSGRGRHVGMAAYVMGCPFHGEQASSIVGQDRTVDLLHKDGSIRKVILGVHYLGKNDDGVDEWAGAMTDVTALVEAIATEKTIREEFEKLQQSWRHDLLSAVLGAHNMFEVLENIGFKVEDPKFKEPYDIARAKAQFAYKLVRDTRDLNVAMEEMVKEPMTLRSLMDSIKILFPEANITYSVMDEDRQVLISESNLVGRAISNIINNAIKFSGLNGIIEVGIRTKDKFAIIYVKDNGIGMDEEGQKKIFSGFGTGVRLRQDIRGDGFGLHSALNVVKAHDGNLTVKSKLGQGSVFFIKIPLMS